MGRPRSASKKTEAIQIRLSLEERENFERLVQSRADELRHEGVEVTPPMVIRWLIAREVASRGLGKSSMPESAKAAPRATGNATAKPNRSRARGGDTGAQSSRTGAAKQTKRG